MQYYVANGIVVKHTDGGWQDQRPFVHRARTFEWHIFLAVEIEFEGTRIIAGAAGYPRGQS